MSRFAKIIGYAFRQWPLLLVILGAIGLGVYAGTLKPPHQSYTVVIPNSRFPT